MTQLSIYRLILATLLAAGLMHLGGCTTTPPTTDSRPLSEYDRGRLGHVLLVPSYDSEESTRGVNWGKGERIESAIFSLSTCFSRRGTGSAISPPEKEILADNSPFWKENPQMYLKPVTRASGINRLGRLLD